MKKLILFLLFSVLVFSQPEHEGELIIYLTNFGSYWDVTFQVEAVSERWDENYQITEEFYSDQSILQGSIPGVPALFDLVTSQSGTLPVVALGLYKISAIEDNQVQAYFYMDWRTSDDYTASPDVTFYYNYATKVFRNHANTQTIDGTYQTHWDLVSGIGLETSGFEDYWDNCLAIIKSETGSHPRLVWGPYPGTINGDYIENRVYKSAAHDPGDPPTNFSKIDAVEDDVFQYIDDTETIGTDYNAKSYYVAAYYEDWQEGLHEIETNIVEVRLAPPSKAIAPNANIIYDYQLCQNYPNPFNPGTLIYYKLADDDFVNLNIYNLLGEEIVNLVEEKQPAGIYQVEFNAGNLPSGVYLYRLQTSKYTAVRKMSLVK